MRMRESHRNQVASGEDWSRSPGSACYFRAMDTNIPGCGTVRRPLCDVQRVGQRLSPIVGQSVFNIVLVPVRTLWYQAWEFLNHVTDTTDPDVNHRLEWQRMDNNNIPQEPFSIAAPALANTNGILTDDYETPPAGSGTSAVGATPVSWAPFSTAALPYVLTLGGVSRHPAQVSCDLYVAAFGNGLDAMPPGLTPGQPFHM